MRSKLEKSFSTDFQRTLQAFFSNKPYNKVKYSMVRRTTRSLCESQRPQLANQSGKLAQFLEQKKLETGLYVHPIIKETKGIYYTEPRPKLIRRASHDPVFSEYNTQVTEEDRRSYFNGRSILLSTTDASTKLSVLQGGTVCAQDYYPSFLLAAESRYELPPQKGRMSPERRSESTPKMPPRNLSAAKLMKSIHGIHENSVQEKYHLYGEKKRAL